MNYQTAGIVGGAAFLLSFLAGLVGGVPFFDVFLRALFWAAVGLGLSLGIEALLRNLVPDLFVPAPATDEPEDASSERKIDITLDGETGNVFEEVDEDEARAPRRRPVVERPSEVVAVGTEGPQALVAAPSVPGEPEEEMPEIGAFLDAFKPNAPEDEGEEGASAAPEYAEYAPEPSERRSNREVTIDGEAQDPVILAKAIQTIMKRDGQGN